MPRFFVGQVDENCCVRLGAGALHLLDAVVNDVHVGGGGTEVVAGEEILGHVVLVGVRNWRWDTRGRIHTWNPGRRRQQYLDTAETQEHIPR